jgi:hypothetical protein
MPLINVGKLLQHGEEKQQIFTGSESHITLLHEENII